MRARTVAAVLLAFATAGTAVAQCPTNPTGGPTYVTLRTAADGAGTDFDVGRNATTHGLEVPALDLSACLADCDASTDPDCAITSLRLAPAARGIAPPMPLLIGGIPLCAALRQPPATFAAGGSANVQTGALSLSTTLQMRLFFTTMNAICPTCVAGTCNGGANDGSACETQRTMTVSSTTYDLSIACQPSEGGFLGSVSVPVTLVTGTASQGACPGQAGGDACSATPSAGTCNQTSCTSGDGIVQDCCSGDSSRSCFPAAGVTRQGQAGVPAPAWPSTTYPKQATETVANATCVAAIGNNTVDQALGLPGPAAAEIDVTTEWVQVDTGTTTTTLGGTTTTLGGGSTTTTTVPGNCAPSCTDDDVCTIDTCTDVTCTYPLASPGIAGARCLAQRMRERPLCGTTAVDAKLERTIDKALGKADTLLGKAEAATGRKRARALKKARAQLTKIQKKTDKAAAKGKIDGVCVLTILGETSRVHGAFADVS